MNKHHHEVSRKEFGKYTESLHKRSVYGNASSMLCIYQCLVHNLICLCHGELLI